MPQASESDNTRPPFRHARLRRRVAAKIHELIGFLDALDGDPDLEDAAELAEAEDDGTAEEDADREPSLCGVEVSADHAFACDGADLEEESDDEPSLGAPQPRAFGSIRVRRRNGERHAPGDQTHWSQGSRDDREVDHDREIEAGA